MKTQNYKLTSKHQNQGVALLTVLAIVGVSGLLAYHLVSLQSLTIAHTALTKTSDQLLAHAWSMEELVIARLFEDWLAGEERPWDSLHEEWASPDHNIDFDNADVYLHVIDLNSKFNANALANVEDELVVEAFTELCTKLNLEYDLPFRLMDWVDEDEIDTLSGGEDFEYANWQIPFRTPNTYAADTSEFNIFTNIDSDGRELIDTNNTVIPTNQLMLNFNTVEKEVLQALLNSTEQNEDVTYILQEEREYPEVEEIISEYPVLTEIQAYLQVTSDFFLMETTIIIPGEGRLDVSTEFYRDPELGDVNIYKRDYSQRHNWE